jgi:hypothetical protein
MSATYQATFEEGGVEITVEADNYKELHRAIAGIQEMERDIEMLKRLSGRDDLVFEFRMDQDNYEYYGFRSGEHSVTLGQTDDDRFPLYPKGEDGYYNYRTGEQSLPDGARGGGSGPHRNEEDRSEGPRPEKERSPAQNGQAGRPGPPPRGEKKPE